MPVTDTLTTSVLHIVTSKFGAPEGTTADTAYEDMDFDSLVLVELAVHLSKVYGVPITDEEIVETRCVAGTVELLAGRGIR